MASGYRSQPGSMRSAGKRRLPSWSQRLSSAISKTLLAGEPDGREVNRDRTGAAPDVVVSSASAPQMGFGAHRGRTSVCALRALRQGQDWVRTWRVRWPTPRPDGRDVDLTASEANARVDLGGAAQRTSLGARGGSAGGTQRRGAVSTRPGIAGARTRGRRPAAPSRSPGRARSGACGSPRD